MLTALKTILSYNLIILLIVNGILHSSCSSRPPIKKKIVVKKIIRPQLTPSEMARQQLLKKYRIMRLEAQENPNLYRHMNEPPKYRHSPKNKIIKIYPERIDQDNKNEEQITVTEPPEEFMDYMYKDPEVKNYPKHNPIEIETVIGQNIDYYCIKTEANDCREIATNILDECREKYPNEDDKRIISCLKSKLR